MNKVGSELRPVDASDSAIFQSSLHFSVLILFLVHAVSAFLPTIPVFEFRLGMLAGEGADKAAFIATLFLVVVFHFFPEKTLRLYQATIGRYPYLSLLFTLLVLASLATRNVLPGYKDYSAWWGYGWKVAALGLLATLLTYYWPVKARRYVSILLSYKIGIQVLFWIIVISYALSLFTPPLSLINGHHSDYVINEVLGPVMGRYPGINFIAQYTQNLGYFFKALGFSTEAHALYLLEALKFLALFLLAYVLRLMDKKFWQLTLVLVFGIAFGTNEYAHYLTSGSIAYLHSALPIRFVGPIICFWALHKIVSEQDSSCNWKVVLGFFLGVGFLLNVEIGIATLIAISSVVFISRASWKTYIWIFGSFAAVLLLQLSVMSYMAGQLFIPALFFAFIGGFSSGFGALPMPIWGLWIAIFSLTVALITYGCRVRETTDGKWFAYIYFGVLALVALPYYINRSVNSGQLQLIIIYVSIPLALFVTKYIACWFHEKSASRCFISFLPILLFWFCAFSSIGMPNPGIELVRLIRGFETADANLHLQSDSNFLSQKNNLRTGSIMSFDNILGGRWSNTIPLARMNNEDDASTTRQIFYLCEEQDKLFDQVLVSLTLDAVRAQVSSELSKCGFTRESRKGFFEIYEKN